jgi:hypothetical protein
MNADQQRNIEKAINDLCENLVWSWAYFRTLKGLQSVAKSSPNSLDTYPQLTSCLYHGLFDVLFIKIHNFIDSSRGACGFPKLFKLLRKYLSDDINLMEQIRSDEGRFKNEADIETVKRWRNEISAHLTQSYRDSAFFSSMHLHLSDLEGLLKLIEEIVGNYSFSLLNRFNDTRNPSAEIIQEIERLLLPHT